MIGQLLDGRYKIISTLSAGGFGETYMAEDTRIPGNPKCVVKHLKPASTNPNVLLTARRLFQSEAESLAKVGRHDQIPQLYAYFEANEQFYLVEEFIEGHPLSQELAPGKQLSEPYVVALLKGLLPVLEYIHQQNPPLIHRDIKPANIIRRKQDGKLVLIDFGAVKEVRSPLVTVQNSEATVSIGTPGYMPTEQGRGKPRPNSDIYALGMIGIQALTGRSPNEFEEDSQTGEVLWQHQAVVSPGLAGILTQMVRYHFKDRYQTATEALQALEQLANPTIPPTVTSPPPGYQPTQPEQTLGVTQVHELTLEWMQQGQVKSYTLSDKQASKHPGTIRIGRDPQQCDLVLSDATVSGLHVEIFFNPQQQRFYLRNLRENNPPLVDGQPLVAGEVPLYQGRTLRLGQQDIGVKVIALKQYPAGYQPAAYATQHENTPQQPVAPTIQPPEINPTPVTPTPQFVSPPPAPNPPPVRQGSKKLPWIISGTIVGVAGLLGRYAISQLNNHRPLNSVATTQEKNCTVAINSLNVRSQAGGDVIGSVSQGTSLSPTGNQDGIWLEIDTPQKGWVGTVDKQGRQLVDCPAGTPIAAATRQTSQNSNNTENQKESNSQKPEVVPVGCSARVPGKWGDSEEIQVTFDPKNARASTVVVLVNYTSGELYNSSEITASRVEGSVWRGSSKGSTVTVGYETTNAKGQPADPYAIYKGETYSLRCTELHHD